MNAISDSYETIVIGGGIVGTSVAYHLVSDGIRTLLIDRNDAGRATDAGTGVVSTESSGYDSDTMHQFMNKAARYYPDIVSDIESTVNVDHGYSRCGTLSVAVSEDEQWLLNKFKQRVRKLRQENGYPPAETLHDVSPREAERLFPPLSDIVDAFYYEGGARVDGRSMNQALVRTGRECGLDTLEASAEGIETEGNAVASVTTEEATYRTENVVVAGGAWSEAFEDDLGVDIPVVPERGQMVRFNVETGDTADWPVVRGFNEHYLVPLDDDSVGAGATRDTSPGFSPHSTVMGVNEVLTEAIRTAPRLSDAEFQEVRVGLRPLSEDGLPIIGETTIDGAYLATGHGSLGLTLGPYTGKIVAEAVDGTITDDYSLFSPGRFEN